MFGSLSSSDCCCCCGFLGRALGRCGVLVSTAEDFLEDEDEDDEDEEEEAGGDLGLVLSLPFFLLSLLSLS